MEKKRGGEVRFGGGRERERERERSVVVDVVWRWERGEKVGMNYVAHR